MPQKSIREMSRLERQHYSFASRSFRTTIMGAVILGLIALAIGLGLYAVALGGQYTGEAFNLSRNAQSIICKDVNVEPLVSEVMERYYAMTPAQILTDTNASICSNNHEEMFVTVWLGILELSTEKLTAANAGHEYPVLKKADGQFELLKDKHGFVIGGMDGARYKEYELQMEPGSKLFLYTDGVPEATDAQRELFGTERMLAALNEAVDAKPKDTLQQMHNAVNDFVKDAEQFDDLTMLCVQYIGKEAQKDG